MPMNAIVYINRMENTTTDGVAPPYKQQNTLHSLHCTAYNAYDAYTAYTAIWLFGPQNVSDVNSGYP